MDKNQQAKLYAKVQIHVHTLVTDQSMAGVLLLPPELCLAVPDTDLPGSRARLSALGWIQLSCWPLRSAVVLNHSFHLPLACHLLLSSVK